MLVCSVSLLSSTRLPPPGRRLGLSAKGGGGMGGKGEEGRVGGGQRGNIPPSRGGGEGRGGGVLSQRAREAKRKKIEVGGWRLEKTDADTKCGVISHVVCVVAL